MGTIVMDEAYAEALTDIEGFSHVILIYHFHLAKPGFAPIVKPFLDDRSHGLFATRAPRRPNPIHVVDGTPLLDIKPFVPAFDAPRVTAIGWLEGKTGETAAVRSDERFKNGDD